MYRKYQGFLHFFASRSQSKPTKNTDWYLQCFDKTACKKNTMFSSNFSRFFSPCSSVQKTLIFYSVFATAHPDSTMCKSGQIAKLHLNSTLCLSQSLPQSCNTKNYRRLSGASKCCKLRCFIDVPCIYLQKKGPPPQLKLTVLVPPERHALLHLRCGRIFNISHQFDDNESVWPQRGVFTSGKLFHLLGWWTVDL